MKHFLVIFMMLLFYHTDAQDYKWYINNTKYLNTTPGAAPSYGSPSTIKSCNILNVSHPVLTYGNERNDIFIIYNDGNHFNSRYIETSRWSDYQASSDYYIGPSSTREITHLYYSNVYEDDDEPNARIEITPPSTPITSELLVNIPGLIDKLPISPPSAALTSNHSIVTGKDLTLIIANDSLGDCKYDLCFNTFYDKRDSPITPPLNYHITGPEIFGNVTSPNSFVASGARSSPSPTTLQPKNDGISGDTCIKNLSIDYNYHYTYVNLNIPEYPGGIMHGQLLEISLTPNTQNFSCPSYSIKDTIRDSNDPNYVQLMCVNTEPNSQTSIIKYRAYCMNDGLESQPNPSIEFTFPYTVSLSDIEVTRAKIRNSIQNTGFNRYSPSVTIDPYTPNRVKFSFSGCLENCPPPSVRAECESWVEFCVTVDSDSVNVLTDTLEPFDRNTNFGSTKYPIHDYRDLPCCRTLKPRNEGNPNDSTTPKESVDNIYHSSISNTFKSKNSHTLEGTSKTNNSDWHCLRENRYCDCNPDLDNCLWFSIICNNNIQWLKIGCILLLLLIIFLLKKKKAINPT